MTQHFLRWGWTMFFLITRLRQLQALIEQNTNILLSQGFSDGAQSGPVPERPQRGPFRRDLRNRRAMSCGARQLALAKRVRMSWVQRRRSLRRHARCAALIPV